MSLPSEPPPDCPVCARLVDYRETNRKAHADWFNAPVPSFGPDAARLLIVGLAPGLQGANRTGRPFTGDYAGDLLYATLLKFSFAVGRYDARADDGLELVDCMITNAVRCVPPQNKPTGPEAASCRPFLTARIEALPRLKVILALGRIAHDQVVSALGGRRAAHAFGHGHCHAVIDRLSLYDSYHCSRYNTNTGRLTVEMFEAVLAEVRKAVDRPTSSRA
ncbi:MAG: uracil-DNA glycosylase [Methyloligellaceae bacterium]